MPRASWFPRDKRFLEDRIDYILDNYPSLNADDRQVLADYKVALEHQGFLIQPQEERLDSIYNGWIDR